VFIFLGISGESVELHWYHALLISLQQCLPSPMACYFVAMYGVDANMPGSRNTLSPLPPSYITSPHLSCFKAPITILHSPYCYNLPPLSNRGLFPFLVCIAFSGYRFVSSGSAMWQDNFSRPFELSNGFLCSALIYLITTFVFTSTSLQFTASVCVSLPIVFALVATETDHVERTKEPVFSLSLVAMLAWGKRSYERQARSQWLLWRWRTEDKKAYDNLLSEMLPKTVKKDLVKKARRTILDDRQALPFPFLSLPCCSCWLYSLRQPRENPEHGPSA
jgi:hypothetical protein